MALKNFSYRNGMKAYHSKEDRFCMVILQCIIACYRELNDKDLGFEPFHKSDIYYMEFFFLKKLANTKYILIFLVRFFLDMTERYNRSAIVD